MSTIRYMQRGKKRLWAYNIRDEIGKSIAYKSGFATKKEATLEGEKLMNEIRNGTELSSSITLIDLYQKWLDLKILPSNRSFETKKKYISRKNIVLKMFGNKPVSKIKASEYQRKMNIYGQSVTRNTLSRLHTSIKLSIKLAQSDNIYINDFTSFVDLFSTKPSQDIDEKYLHKEEDYNKILDYLYSKLNYHQTIVPYLIICLFKTGMRYGELVAITWSDVDFEKQTIKTYRRYNTVTNKFVSPKNSQSVRVVPISNDVKLLLLEIKKSQSKVNEDLFISNKNDFVFQHYGYKNEVPNIATVNKAIKKILLELGIWPILTTKGARHTYGSILWHRGIDLGVIAKVLGHKDISMLVEVYGHTLEEKINHEFETIRQII